MTQAVESFRAQRVTLRSAAALSGLAAVAALAGWHLHLPLLVQWVPGASAMQYNTALGLVLCSVGLFLIPAEATKFVLSTGGLAALLGLLTLSESLGAGDLHIDQLAFKSWLTSGTDFPGRMGANTAVCMTLTGLALLLMAYPPSRRRHAPLIGLAGWAVVIIGMVALVGYSMSLESAYRWGSRTQMAGNTAVAFLAIGCGLIVCALSDGGEGRPLHNRYTPAMIGMASVAFTLLLWQALEAEGARGLMRGSEAAMGQVTFELKAQLANLDGALQRISRRWPADRAAVIDPSTAGRWDFDAGEYIVDFPGLEALQWRDESSGGVRAAPRKFMQTPGYFKLGWRPGGFVLTGPRDAAMAGSRTVAVINYAAWLATVFHKEVATGYSISVAEHGADIFKRLSGGSASASDAMVTAAVDIAGTTWSVRVWPGSGVLASSTSHLTALVLVGGLLMSVLLALTARLILAGGERAAAIEDANRSLQAEVVERQKGEVRLEEAKSAAEVATRAKSEFLSNMSHEIRSPMNAILGMADLLWDSDLNGEQREYVGAFRRAGTNLLTLINDILDIAKVESGKFELHPLDFDLDDLLRTLDILRGRAVAKGLRLSLRIAPDVPRTLHGDADRLRQVLINLLGNAIKFTSAGEVSLEIALAEPSSTTPLLRFQVTDTGPGISAHRLAGIFESFTQADSSVAHHYGGTGLGLTISRNLVELMGGRIEVSSEEGRGSVFSFAIHLLAAANVPLAPLVAEIESSHDTLAGGRLLLVEDSKDNELLIRAYLRNAPYQIEIARDGQAAFDQFTFGTFDLILMDVQLPIIDGYAATRKIREWETQHSARRVPILALTANAMAEGLKPAARRGATLTLVNPSSGARFCGQSVNI